MTRSSGVALPARRAACREPILQTWKRTRSSSPRAPGPRAGRPNPPRPAWAPREPIEQGGLLKYMHGGEYHMYNPEVIATLQAAVASGDYATYLRFAALVNERPAATFRDLLELQHPHASIPIDEVEPLTAILARFDSAGMSLGALSPEAHEALAIAMNRLGARSNSGEGGEDPARYRSEKNSKIKQVASGRFGVTPEYLINAEVL